MPPRRAMALSRRAGHWPHDLMAPNKLSQVSSCCANVAFLRQSQQTATTPRLSPWNHLHSRALSRTASVADAHFLSFSLQQRRTFASSLPKVLFFAAQEADRLSTLAVTKHKRRGTISALTEAANVTQALDAANALLIISRPSNALADAILHRTERLHIASLHRAFIAITSWCVDLIPLIQSDKETTNSTTADVASSILDRSLMVARRAYDLHLPFHLPLYQRLMTAVALHKTDTVASTILDISSWATSTLDAPMDAAFFSRSLTALIRRQRLSDVVDLLVGMRSRHEIVHLDEDITMEVLMHVSNVIRQALEDPASSLQEAQATKIVALLELSVLHIMETRQASEFIREDRLASLLSSLEDDEMGALLDRIAQAEEEEHDADGIYDDTSDDDSDEEGFSSDEDRIEHGRRCPDPLDLAVNSIMTKSMTSDKAKHLLPALIKHASSVPGDSNERGHPRIREISFPAGDDMIHAKLDIDTDSDLTDDDDDFDEMLYSRTKEDLYQFPDVTAQMVELNGGRTFRFTRSFEDIIWARDYEDDSYGLFDRIIRSGQHRRDHDDDDSSSSSDDDSDDDHDER